MTTQALFVLLVAAVALQRGLELLYSDRNVDRLLACGGREHAPRQMGWMMRLHAVWLVGMVVEVLALRRHFIPALAIAALVLFAAGQTLRYAAMHGLGTRWTTRIITVPGERAVSSGIFRYLRHPNYLGVALEIFALPLVHGAWLTAIVASALNALLLARRIDAEETALRLDSHYAEELKDRPRMIPALSLWRRG